MVFICLSCLFLPAGIVLTVIGLRQGRGRNQGTLAAQGQILEATVLGKDSEDETSAVELRFEYEVDGQTFEADQRVSSWLFRLGGNLPSYLDRFGPGSDVTVRYDPAQPQEATVDQGWAWTGTPLILLGVFCLIFSIAPFIPGSLFLQVFGAGWLLIAFFLIIRGIIELQQASAQSWSSTPGTILDSQVLSAESAPGEPPTWWLEVKYRYELEDEEFQGRRIRSGGPILSPNKAAAEKMADRYPVGKQVTVIYNPDDPTQAFLEKGTSRGWLFIALGILILLAIIVMSVFVQVDQLPVIL